MVFAGEAEGGAVGDFGIWFDGDLFDAFRKDE